MVDWSDMPEDEAPLKDWSEDTHSPAGWDNDANKEDSAWNDNPKVDEPADDMFEESYETPEAPAEPATDEFGRAAGVVKAWRAEKAFGFIGRDDGGSDVFVHKRDIGGAKELIPGDEVSYRFEISRKKACAKDVVVECATGALELAEHSRETGVVRGWREEKGFGFIGRGDGGSDVFCHSKDIQGLSSLAIGSLVSFRYEESAKGGSAKEVRIEEDVPAVDEGPRESGTITSWNTEKGFGFIQWSGEKDLFAHNRDVMSGNELAIGQAVSFVIEEGPKGPSAKKVQEEEGGELVLEDESERLYGKVKSYDEEKGFCFITRCDGGGEVFGHKRNFQGGVEPAKGMGVSFVVESGDKGDSAMRIREEGEIPEMIFSDKGREFGTIVKWIEEKRFGYIQRKNGGEEAHVHARACDGFSPKKGTCVSFVFEENDKGPTAKDVREEDPERVARVTAVRRYGTVHSYADPPRDDLNNGYGFIIPDGPQAYGAPRKYYFHMDNIATPDEYGGLWPEDYVSFIVMPAKKGFQAVDVTLEEMPAPNLGKRNQQLETQMEQMEVY